MKHACVKAQVTIAALAGAVGRRALDRYETFEDNTIELWKLNNLYVFRKIDFLFRRITWSLHSGGKFSKFLNFNFSQKTENRTVGFKIDCISELVIYSISQHLFRCLTEE